MARASLLSRPVTHVRRKDRRLDDPEWMDRLLRTASFGHLALCQGDRPLLHSNLFWYDGAAVYFHTALVGRVRAALEAGPQPAVFGVAEHGRILPAATPFDFSTEYASVFCYGEIAILRGIEEKRPALEGLMAKYAPHLVPGRDYEPMPDRDIANTSVYRLVIAERVGKHNVKPDDYPAYPYPAESFIAAERAAGRATLRPKELEE